MPLGVEARLTRGGELQSALIEGPVRDLLPRRLTRGGELQSTLVEDAVHGFLPRRHTEGVGQTGALLVTGGYSVFAAAALRQALRRRL